MANGSDNKTNTDTGSMRKAQEVDGKIILNADNQGMAVPSAGKTQALPGISDPMAMRNTDTGNLRKMAEDTTTRKTIKLKPIRPRGTQPGSLKPVLPGAEGAKPSSPTVRVAASDVASAVAAGQAKISDMPGNKDGVETVSISRIKAKKTAKLSPLPSVAKAKSVPSKNTIKLRPSTATATSQPVEEGAPGEKKKTATIKITAIPGKKKNASKKTIKLTPSTAPQPDAAEDAAAAASAPTVGLTPPARSKASPIDLSDAGTVVLQEPPPAEDTTTQAIRTEKPPVEAKPDVSAAGSISITPPTPQQEQEEEAETKTQAIRVKPPQQAKPDISAVGTIDIKPPAPGEDLEKTSANAFAPTIVAGMDSPSAPQKEDRPLGGGISANAPTIVAGIDSLIAKPDEPPKPASPGGLSIGAPPPPPAGAGAPEQSALGGLQIQHHEDKEEAELGPPLAQGEKPGRLKGQKTETQQKASVVYTMVAVVVMALLVASAYIQTAQFLNSWQPEWASGVTLPIPAPLADLGK